MVKRAYLDLALRHHPDRHQDLSAAQREQAEFRMREVNDAWAVLRNPAARARYDDELRRAGAGIAAPPPAPGPSSAAARAGVGSTARDRPEPVRREPPVADLASAAAPSAPVRPRSRWTMLTPVLIGAAVLLGVVVLAAAAQDDGPKVQVDTVEEYGVGTCVVVAFGPALATDEAGDQAREAVLPVPCTQPGSYRVVGRVPFPKPCPQGSVAQLLADSRESLCLV